MGICREIYQEGIRIPPIKLIAGGQLQEDVFRLLLNNVRTPEEREGDLNAQIAACHTGADAPAGDRGALRPAPLAARDRRVAGVLGEADAGLSQQGSAWPL